MMFGVGFSEFIAFLFFLAGGGMGLPMGLPPGPEDPMMAKIAPEECYFYASWSGVADADPAANPTEKWMAQPKIASMLTKLRSSSKSMLLKNAEKQSDPVAAELIRFFVDVATAGSVEPVAFYIDKISPPAVEADGPIASGALFVSLGDQQADVTERFGKCFDLVSKAKESESLGAVTAMTIDGEKVLKIDVSAYPAPIFATIRDKYFVIGLGEGSLKRAGKNAQSPPPSWLTNLREKLTVERVSSVSYLNLKKLTAVLGKDAKKFELFPVGVFENELNGLDTFAWVSGLDEKGFLTRTAIEIADDYEGILKLLDPAPIKRNALSEIPADATAAIATRIAPVRVMKIVESFAEQVRQEEALENSLQEFQELTGLDLKTELLESLGDYSYVYWKPDFAGLMVGDVGGLIISVGIDDDMSFPGILDKLNKGIKDWADEDPESELQIEIQQHGENEIFVATDRWKWRNFAWSQVDDQWIIARKPDDILNHIKSNPKEKQLAQLPIVQEIYAFGEANNLGAPVTIADLNLPPIFSAIWPIFDGFRGDDFNITSDFDFKWGDIPPLEPVIKDVGPNLTGVFRTAEGYQLLQRQTYPGSSPPVSILAFAVGGIAYELSNLEARKVTESKNNMRQLALAIQNFESAHMKFPAPYSTDDEGKPLLSWRVHVLPFIEGGELYDQFHLDEPWDSEHNKTLIEKMPVVFKRPGVKLPNGKTVWVVPTGKSTIFELPGKEKTDEAGKVGFGQITDGTSNTILIVEVDKAHAVTWTQPVDTAGDAVKLKKRLPKDRFVVAIGDGSVHTMESSIDTTLLERLIQRNDGEIVDFPDRN